MQSCGIERSGIPKSCIALTRFDPLMHVLGLPLGLAGIFFDLLARTHLQHLRSLVAFAVADGFLTPLQRCSCAILPKLLLLSFARETEEFELNGEREEQFREQPFGWNLLL